MGITLGKIKKRIRRFTHPRESKHKGHEMILKHRKAIAEIMKPGDFIVEIGSDREAGSTRILAEMARKNGAIFITVDVDEETTRRADSIVKAVQENFQAINDYGEAFLERFNESISLLYLDAFDLPGDWHSEEVIESYQNRNTELTLENCYKMHLDSAKAVLPNIKQGGYVCFDDVNPVDSAGQLIFKRVSRDHQAWSGKGKTAIPFLLENGFELVDNIRACALLRKQK